MYLPNERYKVNYLRKQKRQMSWLQNTQQCSIMTSAELFRTCTDKVLQGRMTSNVYLGQYNGRRITSNIAFQALCICNVVAELWFTKPHILNAELFRKIRSECILFTTIKTRKLLYFSHIVLRARYALFLVIQGKEEGKPWIGRKRNVMVA